MATLRQDVSAEVKSPVEDLDSVKEIQKPDALAAYAISLVHAFRESHFRETRARAKRCFEYYNNQQWPKEVLEKMRSDKRPVVTFNEIRPKVDLIIGEERRNREDWVARPREGSDENEANVRTALLKYVRDINNLYTDESRAFEDEVVGGYGGLLASLVKSEDTTAPLLKIEYRPWRELCWDWNVKARDFSDAQWMAVAVPIALEKLQEMFPDVENQIADEYYSLVNDPVEPEVDIGERVGVSRYKDGDIRPDLFTKEGRQLQAIEFYYRTVRKTPMARLFMPDGKVIDRIIPEDNPEVKLMLEDLIKQGKAEKYTKRENVIAGAFIVGRMTLASWVSEFRGKTVFGMPMFPIFVAFASDTDNYVTGIVESMLGPQDEVNKRWSMTVENYLHQARSGGVYEEGAFSNIEEVKKMWGSPGYWAQAKSGAIAGAKFKEHVPKPTDQALMLLFEHSERALDRVSNIERARMGLTSQETSGVAIRQRALQSSLVHVKAFDNFRMMQLNLGKFVNANLPLIFPSKKIIRLTMPNGENRQVTLNDPQQMADGTWRIVNSTAPDAHDITIDLTQSSATFREMTANNVASLLGQIGPPMKELPQFLPAYAEMLKSLILSLDGFPNKDKIAQLLEQASSAFGGGLPGMPGMPNIPGLGSGEMGPPPPQPTSPMGTPISESPLAAKTQAVSGAMSLGG